jgi:hypothetical protein
MKALTSQEAKTWCDQRSIHVAEDGYLYYGNPKLDFTIELLEKASRLTALAAWLLPESEKIPFQGALLWVKEWGIWAQHSEEAGMKIIETLRLAHGETRSLKAAPAMLFGPQELRDLHAFFIQPLVFGWDAFMIPVSEDYFVFNSHDEIICVIAKTEEEKVTLMTRLQDWKPQEISYYFSR